MKRNRLKIYFLAAAGWTFIILILSLFPLSLFSFSGDNSVKSPVSDKIIHAIFYFVFTLLWYTAVKNRKIQYNVLKIFAGSLIYGIIIEVLQDVMPFNRQLEIMDIIANVTGTCIGIIFIKIRPARSGIALKTKK